MSPVHDVPLDVTFEEHATFQKFLHKSCRDTSRSWDSIDSSNSSISSAAPDSNNEQDIWERDQLRLKLSESDKRIVSLRKQVVDTMNMKAQLSQKLKKAIARKCDLVVECTELESQKLSLEEKYEKESRKLQLEPLKQQETRAQVEKEFMNAIDHLLGEMNDMHRRHRNVMLEKDMEIVQLQEKIRQEQWKRAN
jgi:phenylpropionate dioxygenase-like ring-hydroxylating dioxygenase large terminal subunit